MNSVRYGGYETEGHIGTSGDDAPKTAIDPDGNEFMYGGWFAPNDATQGGDWPTKPPPLDPAFTAEQELAIQFMAHQVAVAIFARRTMPKYPAYFGNSDWLVTYDWLQETRRVLQSEIDWLRREVRELQQPWWKRWFT